MIWNLFLVCFIHNLFLLITEYFKNGESNKIKIQYLKKLDIICYGIYKEDKND